MNRRSVLSRMVSRLVSVFLALAVSALFVQAERPPQRPAEGLPNLSAVYLLTMPGLDNKALLDRDKDQTKISGPFQFAEPVQVDNPPAKSGTWETLKGGDRCLRMQVVSEGALSLNLGFTRYWMPPGGSLFIYTPDKSRVIGPFTEADNEDHGQLWTPILPGDHLVLEVILPPKQEKNLELELTYVNHGYRPFGVGGFEKSGSCNVDVVCPEGNQWREQIRSVAAFSRSGSFACSGFLVNNTAQDLKPYFMTAAHCAVTPANASTLVVYWEYENSTCRPPGSAASGQDGDGSLDVFNTGATYNAGYTVSDFTLVLLDDPINSNATPFWAGWDRSSNDPTSAVAIHQPGVDEKRISFENDPVTTTTYLQDPTPGDGTHLRVEDWDVGTTEPGSSGSPLFNQNKRVVGQLHGGFAACGNNLEDWYGRLSISWEGGGSSGNRLKDWLDPLSLGVQFLDGTDTDAPDGFSINAFPTNDVICAGANVVFAINVTPTGDFSGAVTLSASGNPPGTLVNFTIGQINPPGTLVNFTMNPIGPPAQVTLTISDTGGALAGSYNIEIVGTSGSDMRSANVTLVVFDSVPDTVVLSLPPDQATDVSISPSFTWTAVTQVQAYNLEVARDFTFSDIVYSADETGTTHTQNSSLGTNTTYYWRILAENKCGIGKSSETFSFTTGDEIRSAPNVDIPDSDPLGISDSIIINEKGKLVDMDVFVNISHTYVGDLIISLEHEDTGTNVVLVDRPGTTISPFGCPNSDINAVLDDDASTLVEDECSSSPPAISGSFIPNNPLSVFVGENLSGTWTLTVSDNALQDFGTLLEWGLRPAVEVPTPTPSPPPESTPTPQPISAIRLR